MKDKQFDCVVFIGRFQPVHDAHVQILQEALRIGKEVIVVIGSANSPRTVKNPWTVDERMLMIHDAINDINPIDNDRIIITNVEDRLYNTSQWLRSVQELISTYTDPLDKIAIIGHDKDASSFYLDSFPQWTLVKYPQFKSINATDVRRVYLDPRKVLLDNNTRKDLPNTTINFLVDFSFTDNYKMLVEEFNFLRMHNGKWKSAPYTPTFNTCDAVVFHSGHILLIKRRAAPGSGLWALPGGYINPEDETSLDGAIRELIEETKIKGPSATTLRDKVFSQKTFDHKDRSSRGRIITQAFGIDLGYRGALPKVKGADDAEKAKWFTLDEVKQMRSVLFEDHADIINYFIGEISESVNQR